MADYAVTNAVRDSGVEVTMNAAQADTKFPIGKDERLALIVTNGSGASVNVTIKKGNGIRSVLGDKVVAVGAGKTFVIGPLDSMRFAGSDGKIQVLTSAQTSVTIGVIQL